MTVKENILYPANIYLLRFYSKNARRRCEIYSKLTVTTPEGQNEGRYGVFIINFELISQPFLVFLLLTLSMYLFGK